MLADIKPRVLATAIDLEDGTVSLEIALSVSSYFESAAAARKIAAEAGYAVAAWRKTAGKIGLAPAEIGRMASAFEHEDFGASMALGRPRA